MAGRIVGHLAALAMLAAVPGLAVASEPAAEIAARFCAARIAYDEEATRALLTPGLLAAIVDAEARNKVIADSNPDDKPPLGDGIPYAAYPDSPDTCEPGASEVDGSRTLVDVRYGFANDPSGWTDRLVLVLRNGGALAVDDVLFTRFPTDSEQYGLRRALVESFDYWGDEAD